MSAPGGHGRWVNRAAGRPGSGRWLHRDRPITPAGRRGRTARVGLPAAVAVALVVILLTGLTVALTTAAAGGRPGEPAPAPGETTAPGAERAPASEVPMPVGDLPGWRQVFTDDFAGDDLDDRWLRYEGQPERDPGGWFDPSHLSVGDGKLVIGAWPEPARDSLYVTGGVSNRDVFAQTYGRFEVRFRMAQGTGIAYALLLWPQPGASLPEIDFAEDNGRDRQIRYGFLHPADPAAPTVARQVATDATEWHTAGLEWTPERLVFTMDGQPWATIEGPQVPSEPMSLALQSQAWFCGHTWEACPDRTTPPRVDLEIDWVAIWARQPSDR